MIRFIAFPKVIDPNDVSSFFYDFSVKCSLSIRIRASDSNFHFVIYELFVFMVFIVT